MLFCSLIANDGSFLIYLLVSKLSLIVVWPARLLTDKILLLVLCKDEHDDRVRLRLTYTPRDKHETRIERP
jgi:hypothetical protein